MKKRIISTVIVTILSVSFLSVSWVRAQDFSVDVTAHQESVCSGQFIAHTLQHTTTVAESPIRMFDSNGSGLAINDLNKDGLLDIVLANLDGEESILWNNGDLTFRQEALDIPGKTRAVIILDLDADGWNDISFTTQRGAPTFWRNNGDGSFELTGLVGVSNPAYAMNWADLDRDGDLDLVAASYDAEMERIDASYLLNGGAGVYYYENQGDRFSATRLADKSQALTVFFADISGDNLWDIIVGNDFAELDNYFLRAVEGWVEAQPFTVMTHSTMSFAGGDIHNDGTIELYATDMHPYSDDQATMDAWQPVMEDMMAMPMMEDDPQVMVNVLQTITDGAYSNESESLGIQYTGWSWSSKFGDLNSDSYLDLYIVNGMIAEDLFGHLPNNELVEENQALMNVAGSAYVPAPEWGLNATESGRGMSMADMDGDGDLDIVVNNLMSPAVLYENQLCNGSNLTLELVDTTSANQNAIGAQVRLVTNEATLLRDVHALSGYLSGDASQMHFGFPKSMELIHLEITWPDGETSTIEDLEANTHMVISRNS